MVVAAILTFGGLTFFAAPYGKYSASKGWGPLISAQVAWMIMESPNLWVSTLVYCFWNSSSIRAINNDVNKIAMFCFLLHYVNRSIIYPLRMQSSSCTSMPMSVMLAAFLFCSWNGLNQALSLIVLEPVRADQHDHLQSIIGGLVFLTGFIINVYSDSILINSRQAASSVKTAQKSKYIIPTGGLFGLVSCANYCECSLLNFIKHFPIF